MPNKVRHRRSRPSNDQAGLQAASELNRGRVGSGSSTPQRGQSTPGIEFLASVKEGVNGVAGAGDTTKIDGGHSVNGEPAPETSPTVIEIQETSTVTANRATPFEAEASQAWAKCAEEVWRREEATVQMWKDQISTLLTFAGLFSAALTAFNVQYYVYLLPQTPEVSIQLLTAIHGQLSILTANAGETGLTQTTSKVISDSESCAVQSVPKHALTVNTLWFSALVFSLSAASLAISASEWLLHHTDRSASMSRQSVRVWYFRRRGIEKWHVPFIISILPVLLQISLALFLVGLIELLWSVDTTIGAVIASLVITLLAAQIFTTFIPASAPDCPFKTSPALWWYTMLQLFKMLLSPVERQFDNWCQTISQSDIFSSHEGINNRISRGTYAILSFWRDRLRHHPKLSNWREFDNHFVAARMERSKDDLAMLLQADAALIDDDILAKIVRPCFHGSDSDAAFSAFKQIIQRRVPVDVDDDGPGSLNLMVSQLSSSVRDSQLFSALGEVALDMVLKEAPAGDEQRLTPSYRRSLDLVKTLLAMPDLECANALYSRLWVFLSRADMQDNIRADVESLAWSYCHHKQAEDVQSRLSCAKAVCNDLGVEPVSWYGKDAKKNSSYKNPHWYHVAQAMERIVIDAVFSIIAATNGHDMAPDYNTPFELLRDLLHATEHAGRESVTFRRLLLFFTTASTPPEVQALTAKLMLKFYPNFDMGREDVRKILSFVPECKARDMRILIEISASAFFLAARLPPEDFVLVQDEIQGALAAVAAYFNGLAQKKTRPRLWPILMVSNSCIRLAEKDASLITPQVLEAWQYFLAYPDYTRWAPELKRSIQKLISLVESKTSSNSIAAASPSNQSGSSTVT